jgi:hypothetical protein
VILRRLLSALRRALAALSTPRWPFSALSAPRRALSAFSAPRRALSASSAPRRALSALPAPRRVGAIAVGGALLGLAVLWLSGTRGPAIYDGLPIGTPPYRYLDPPPGSPKTPPPSSVSYAVRLADVPAGVSLATTEPKPQADASIPTQLLLVPPATTEVRVSLGPVPPPSLEPPDGRIDGNVYKVAVATLSGQALQLKPGAEQFFEMELLGTGSQREPHVEQYTGSGWTRLPFTHPQAGIFNFNPSQPGEYALVLPPGHPLFGPGLTAAVVTGGALVVLGGALGGLRARRRRAAGRYQDEGGDLPGLSG